MLALELGVLAGTTPPPDGEYGTFAVCGSSDTVEALVVVSDCPEETAVFYYNKPDGGFAVWIPGAEVSVVNEEFLAQFDAGVSSGTAFVGRCH